MRHRLHSLRQAAIGLLLLSLALPLDAQNNILKPPSPPPVFVGSQAVTPSEGTAPVGNLLLILKVYNQEVQLNSMELLLANKPTKFTADLIDPRDKLGQAIQIVGTLRELQNGTYSFEYMLSKLVAFENNGATQFKTVGWQTTVEISKDQPITLMKNSDTRYVLTLGDAPEPVIPEKK